MNKKNQKLVVANWKMNPPASKEALKTFKDFKKEFNKIARSKKREARSVITVICPPIQYIKELKKAYTGQKIFFGAQDVFYEKEGEYTGQISTEMIKDAGARFVIIGHSEKRKLGETNEIVSKKVLASLKAGLHTVLCVGEKERDHEGNYLKELIKEIKESLQDVPANLLKNLIVAYEPIWAVGEGSKSMNSEEMHFMSLFIKKQLIKIYNHSVANKIYVLYGGSVNSDNVSEFISSEGVDGVLVGRASLNPFEFAKIVSETSKANN